ncbi:heterokaryon incompatibility protein-domain-containing protein [Nemania abortiva]|nr:heterokaryon incompatibility protein-domain-containing protein [Nemania abortiva]
MQSLNGRSRRARHNLSGRRRRNNLKERHNTAIRPRRSTSIQVGSATVPRSQSPEQTHIARPRYRYQPLERHQIRIVEIHPGKLSDPVTISLRLEHFKPNINDESSNVPQYEALSYAWGSRESSDRVFIKHSEINVTQNLSAALKNLRYPDASRHMWIDALCIDQVNEVEKGPYVSMMGEIYHHATSVIVWLGEEENDSDRAMTLLSYVGSQVEIDFDSWAISPSLSSRGLDTTLADWDEPLHFDGNDCISVYFLFCRTWFDRLWVRQEISLAKPDAAIIICGSQSMPWLTFRRALACWRWKPTIRFKYYRQFNKRMDDISDILQQNYEMRFPWLRSAYGHVKCADPRDRIYAILRMDRNAQKLGIEFDYAGMRTHLELYEHVTRRCLDSLTLEILNECELVDLSSTDNFRRCAPSWVPDWSIEHPYLRSVDSGGIYASGCFLGRKFPIVENKLRVVAVPIDKILKIRLHALTPLTPRREILPLIQNFILSSQLNRDYPGGGGFLEACASCFTQGRFLDAYSEPRPPLPCRNDALQLMKRLASDERGILEELPEDGKAVASFFASTVGRIIFTTGKGYIGLAPRSAAPDDEICVLVGCSVPIVLRPVTDNQRIVVGPCYIEGFRDGEAVLGPLPDGIKRKVAQKKGKFICNTFGSSGVIDPRLMEWAELDKSVIRGHVDQDRMFFFEVDVPDLQRHGIHKARYYDLV